MNSTMTQQLVKTLYVMASTLTCMIAAFSAHAGNGAEPAQIGLLARPAKDLDWSVHIPAAGKVIYKGELIPDHTNDGAVGVHSIDVAYSLAIIATQYIKKHGKEEKLQAAADQVLLPYQTLLNNYTYRELAQQGLEKISAGGSKKLVESSAPSQAGGFIKIMPVFTMMQDQSAIILDNNISLYLPDYSSSAPVYENIIRVVSSPREEPDLTSFWMANEGEMLKEESASLFAQSLEIVWSGMDGVSRKDDSAPKTIRYLQGRSEKMERAQLISAHCDRVVIRTLRGWLISVPPSRRAGVTDATECDKSL